MTQPVAFTVTVTKRFIWKSRKAPSSKVLITEETLNNIQLGAARKVCQVKKDVSHIVPSKLNIGVPIKEPKKNDLQLLLRLHFGEASQELPQLEFYKNII